MSSKMIAAESGGLTVLAPDSISASGLGSEKLSLPALQSKMKVDPEGYVTELNTLYRQFNSALEVYKKNAALNFNSLNGISDSQSGAKELGDIASFLAHMTPFYPKHLALFPQQLADFLQSSARTLPSALRCQVTQALILLINRKMVPIEDTLSLFMDLQTLGDKVLKKLAFSQVVHSIRRMNQKHKDEAKNRVLQRILFDMLQQEEETVAKRSLIVACDLHRRRIWFDERTANAICMACFHPSSKIMVAALCFLLDYEKIVDNDDSDDDSSSDEEEITNKAQVSLNKESVYKAHHKGTSSSKKKKQAKLRRVMRSMKRKQRVDSEKGDSSYYSPLNNLKDAQGFAEKLFSRLQSCNERFEVKMMLLKVVARTIGLHRLILLSFYTYVQKYVQPHQRDITNLLAAAVQACHDMVPPDAVEPVFKQIVNQFVPPDAVEPVFKQIVNQFVHDRSRPEAIAVGLNVVREICLRMPLLMTEELLQDLVLYKKSNEKAVSSAARSLMSLFREICPSLLVKKDRGRPIDPGAKPKAFGETHVASDVVGIEYLQQDDAENSDDDIDDEGDDPDIDHGEDSDADDGSLIEEDELEADGEGEEGSSDTDDNAGDASDSEDEEEDDDMNDLADSGDGDEGVQSKSSATKRKVRDFDMTLDATDKSLRALKRLAADTLDQSSPVSADGILSNEEFARIRQLRAKAEAKTALAHHGILKKGADSKTVGFKIPSAEELPMKRVDPSKLEARFHRKMTKDERMALVKAGREETGKYKSSTALKQKKTGGSTNRQKEHKKFMPMAAKRSKISRGRIDKKKKKAVAGKNFRGKKAWK